MKLADYVALHGKQNEDLIRHSLLFYRHNLHASSRISKAKEKEYVTTTVEKFGYGKLKTKDGVLWSDNMKIFQVRLGEDNVFIDTFKFNYNAATEHECPGHLLRILEKAYSTHQAASDAAVKLIDEKINKLKTIKEEFLARELQ